MCVNANYAVIQNKFITMLLFKAICSWHVCIGEIWGTSIDVQTLVMCSSTHTRYVLIVTPVWYIAKNFIVYMDIGCAVLQTIYFLSVAAWTDFLTLVLD